MRTGTYLDHWRDAVFRAPGLSAEIRLFLLSLENYFMDADGNVSESREVLLAHFGGHKRKLGEKFAASIASGLLEQTARGQKYQNAAYRAVIPGSQGADSRPAEDSQGAVDYHPENPAQGAGSRHPETVQGAGGRHPESERIYKEPRTRARPGSTYSNQKTNPDKPRTDLPIADLGADLTSVSQSAREAEALGWLSQTYGLTDRESRTVWHTAASRARGVVEHPVPYLKRMAERGHLADIVAAVQGPTARWTPPEPELSAEPDVETVEGYQPPALRIVPTDPGPPPSPPMSFEEARAYAHLNVCTTACCPRCDTLAAQYPDLRRSGT